MREPLGARPWISGSDEALADLLDTLADTIQAGGSINLEEIVRAHPEHAEELRRLLPTVRVLAGLECRTDGVPSSAPPAFPGPVLETGLLGDYRILGEIGRGGMGIVYEAEQVSLGRRVALKVLPFASALDTRQRQRFQNEAQAAACLHHPNIVPVYGVGSERGIHYYAMQFVDGLTLASVVHGLRRLGGLEAARDSTDPGPDALTASAWLAGRLGLADQAVTPSSSPSASPAKAPAYFRLAAELATQAARALEYAHGQGVVHRDVKPANLLVDTQGRLWVTDFGLARSAGDAGLTRTGDVVGTLRYMSPEQALGRHGAVDQRADVYALGATLYELLTLEPAFAGRDREELLRQITSEEPCPPRRQNPAVPRDLETVVGKAMAKQREERYETAGELAEDLERFLRDEPIRARRPTPVQRAWKWSRRHRLAVTAAVAVLFVAVHLLTAGLVFVWHLHNQMMTERLRAEQRSDLARKAVDEIYLEAEKWLPDDPRRDAFLRKALEFYQEFARERSADHTVLAQAAEAQARVGKIQHLLGHPAEGREGFDQAIALLEKLTSEVPQQPAYREKLARAVNDLGTVLFSTGRLAEAEQAYRRSVSLSEALVAAAPGEYDYRRDCLFAHNGLGLLLCNAGRLAEAEQFCRKAVQLAEGLVRDYPKDKDSIPAYLLADARLMLALVLRGTGRLGEAEPVLRQTVTEFRQVSRDYPGDANYRSRLAGAYVKLGELLRETTRPVDVEVVEWKLASLREKLAHDFPNATACRRDLAEAWRSLTGLLRAADRVREADDCFREARRHGDQLVAGFPRTPVYRLELATCLNEQARLFHETRRPKEAEAAYREAMKMLEQLHATAPADPTCRHNLATTCNNLGWLLEGLGRLREAEESYRRSLDLKEHQKPAFAALPDSQSNLGSTLSNLARVLLDQGRLEESRACAERAVRHQRAALQQNPRHPVYGRYLRIHLGYLADAEVRLGDHRGAAAAVAELAELPADGWRDSLAVARHVARYRHLADEDNRLAPAERQAAAAAYDKQVRELLARVTREGADSPAAQNDVAWFLVSCADPRLRDPGRAVELAEKATRSLPRDGACWNTLGVAHYRAGNWSLARAALEKAVELHRGAESVDWFFLAMTCWHLDERERAGQCYARAREAMKRPADEEVAWVSAEAAALLGPPAAPATGR